VIGIRSVAYLASTRVLTGVIVVIPLYCIAALMASWRHGWARSCCTAVQRVYDHYFNTFLIPSDLLWSFVQTIAVAIVRDAHSHYYGYTASGGPAEWGEAVGAVRASLIRPIFVLCWVSWPSWPVGNFHLAS